MMKLLEESFGAGTRAKAPRLHGDRQKYGLVLVHCNGRPGSTEFEDAGIKPAATSPLQ